MELWMFQGNEYINATGVAVLKSRGLFRMTAKADFGMWSFLYLTPYILHFLIAFFIILM
jgi:hypothetical protein